MVRQIKNQSQEISSELSDGRWQFVEGQLSLVIVLVKFLTMYPYNSKNLDTDDAKTV